MKNLLKYSIFVLILVSIPTYSRAATQNINTTAVVNKILTIDDSLSSIRATAAGKKILSTQLIVQSAIGTASSTVTVRQSYDVKTNATYLEIIASNSQFKMIQRTVKGKNERYIYFTNSFAENMLAITGSRAYMPYADKWVLLDDTKVTIQSILTNFMDINIIPFSVVRIGSPYLVTNKAVKDKSGSIDLDLSISGITPSLNIGKIKYTPIAKQDGFTLTHKPTADNAIHTSIYYTRSNQKGISFVIPDMFAQVSATNLYKEIQLDAKGTIYNLEQSGLVLGSNLPATFSICPKNQYADLSMYCIYNNNVLNTTTISIFAWSSGATKDAISKIKNDIDARRIIPTWFIPSDGRVYVDAYTKTINGTLFAIKEERAYYNNKLNQYITAYTIKDNKLFKIELATSDLADNSITAQRSNLLSFIENNFQKTTTIYVKLKSNDSLTNISLDKISKANISNVNIHSVNNAITQYVVPVRSGFEFDNQNVYNNSVFIRSDTGGKDIQIQINAVGKLGLSPDGMLMMNSSNSQEFEQNYKKAYTGDISTNFKIFKKNGYVFAMSDENGMYYSKNILITRDSLNPSDPYFRVYFSSNKPIEEQLVKEFV